MNKKIVFVTYGGGHVKALLPIIKRCAENINNKVIILGLTTARQVLIEHGYNPIGFKNLYQYGRSDAKNVGIKLVNKLSLDSKIDIEESIAYMGLNYTDLVAQFGEFETQKRYKSQGRQSFSPVSLMENFLSDISPDLVVATSAPRCERAVILAAGNLNIPSICIVDLFAINETQWLKNPNFADKLCVISEYVSKYIQNYGRANDICITGNPAFDSLDHFKKLRQKRIALQSGDNEKVLFWASQPEPTVDPFDNDNNGGDPLLPQKIEKVLSKLISETPKLTGIFRLHPSESRSYKSLYSGVVESTKDIPLYEQLVDADVLVTISSTLALEAALMGIPVITVDMSICTHHAPFSKMGISHGVSDLDELPNAITKSLKEKGVIPADLPDVGLACSKVCSEIESLLYINN